MLKFWSSRTLMWTIRPLDEKSWCLLVSYGLTIIWCQTHVKILNYRNSHYIAQAMSWHIWTMFGYFVMIFVLNWLSILWYNELLHYLCPLYKCSYIARSMQTWQSYKLFYVKELSCLLNSEITGISFEDPH